MGEDSREMSSAGDAQTLRSAIAVVARLPIGQAADVLEMLAICPKSAEILETNPALAVCLAEFVVCAGRGRPYPEPPECAWHKRDELCGFLGFPASGSTVRMLAKVVPEAAAGWRLRQLREPLQDTHLRKLLAHLPIIHAGHLVVAANLWNAHAVSSRLFEEMSTERPEWTAQRHCTLLDDTLWLLGRAVRRPRTFDSLAELIVHAWLVRESGMKGPSAAEPMSLLFPAPPFPGTDDIQPVTSPSDLEEEGRTMDHCVAKFAADVALGKRFVYRMLRPERATIALCKRSGVWRILDIRGRSNEPVNDATTDAIAEWLVTEQAYLRVSPKETLLKTSLALH